MTTHPASRQRQGPAPRRGPVLGWVHRAVAVLALVALLRLGAPLLLPIATAVVLWLLFGPAAEWLERHGVPPALGAAGLAFGPPALLAAAAFFAAPAGAAGIAAAGESLQRVGRLLEGFASRGDGVGGAAHWAAGRLAGNGDAAVRAWAERSAPEALLGLVSALMLLFFLLLGQRSLVAGVLRALPDLPARRRFADALGEARRGVAAFIGLMGAMNLALALATGGALAAIGLPRVPFWTALCFVLVFVPYLGPVAVALLLVVGGVEAFGGGWLMLAPAAAFLALHAVEANFLSPWLLGNRLRLGRPALLVAVMVGAWIGGVTGGLLAVPVLIALAAALRESPEAAVLNALLTAEGAVSDPATASSPAPGAAGTVAPFPAPGGRREE